MPDLTFTIEAADIERYAMTPTLRFRVAIGASAAIENIALQCQLRIEPMRRAYAGGEHEKLTDLFGERARWGETLKTFLWANVMANVPRFDATAAVDVLVPCSFDFDVAATKYFHGLESGDVPVSMLFSGSVFYRDADDRLQISQISWSHGATYRLSAKLWHDLMNQYYPNAAWLRLDRETFERLYRLKRELGAASFDATLNRLLSVSEAVQ
ncbi:MAG TPA: DUF6084 family protein [Rhizomicrobium sp.]|jgi:hypothetical protein|nr:DUF6084 family protein [Rhizomicrobium sp.]